MNAPVSTPPTLTSGPTVTGTEVINCRIIVRNHPSDMVRLVADGAWEVEVPARPSPLSDFAAPGEEARLDDDGWRSGGARLVRRLTELVGAHPVKAKRHLVQIRVPASTTGRHLRNLAQGLTAVGRPPVFSHRDPAPTVRDIRIDLTEVPADVAGAAARELVLGAELGSATALARRIGGAPDSLATPDRWRRELRSAFHGLPGIRIKVRGPGWLERHGFGGLLAVAHRRDTAALVEIVYDADAGDGEIPDSPANTLLVGGAEVPAALRSLARLGAAGRIVGLVPVTGRLRPPQPPLPGRPDEIVEHVGGLTTRLNAVADESRRLELAARLATADALAFGTRRHRPGRVVSVGPTTTAARVALGTRTGALLTGDPDLARRLTLRGAKVGERWWPMPVPTVLEANVSDGTADLTGDPGGPAMLTAALFLRRFAGDTPHVHLDTSGPATATTTVGEVDRGVTGFAARSLVEWLRK